MRMIVKFNVRDWPKRGGFMRADVVVNAKDQDEAVALQQPISAVICFSGARVASSIASNNSNARTLSHVPARFIRRTRSAGT